MSIEGINEYVKQRRDKLNALKEIGVEPYGRRFNKSLSIEKLTTSFKEGENVEHIFKLKNAGGSDLKIDKARGS